MGTINYFTLYFSQSKAICKKYKAAYNIPAIKTFLDIVCCSLKYKSSPNNYDILGFANLSSKQRATYFTHADSKRIMKKYNNPEYLHIFRNKYTFSQVFSEFYGRKAILTEGMTKEILSDFIKGESKIIYKPIDAAQGIGIEVFDVNDFSFDELFKKITSLKNGILETWIYQHPAISRIYPHSVNPIRINTVLCDGKVHFTTSTLSIGHGSKIANASINALFALIDIKSGEILTDACDYSHNTYIKHPETNENIKGFVVPYWKETLSMLERAAKAVPQVGYVGWDIAITENGPVIIEGNNDPGYIGFQLPNFVNGNGTKELYKAFL